MFFDRGTGILPVRLPSHRVTAHLFARLPRTVPRHRMPTSPATTAVPNAAPPASSAARLLDVWEQGSAVSAPRRALLLLAAAHPEFEGAMLGALPVGRRDALLLRLRARLFGPRLEATATCPACGERLEFTVAIDDLLPPENTEPRFDVSTFSPPAPILLHLGGHTLEILPPTAADLVALDSLPASDSAETALLRRCVRSALVAGEPVPAHTLPAPVVAAISERLAEADPLADLRLGLSCPACSHAWSDPLDIVAYLWRELDAWAHRVLREVHALARAYGWTEDVILSLSPARRRHYLDLVAA
jgi:hypothetical protein